MKVVSCLIFAVIVLIFYLSYVGFKSFRGNNKANIDEIQKIRRENNDKYGSYSENFKSKKEDPEENINLVITEPNLIMTIKIDGSDERHEIELELFDDIVPLTSKNFRVLASKGVNNKSYRNSIFHRVIKNFMIQGGDIMNSDGTGSVSIFGNQFEDENFKIKHDQKGLLSMANSGPNTNGSQFFITTEVANHLDNKHVVFGKVVKGYNVIDKIENLATDTNDKPYQNVQIINISEK